jgi:hypothetical protein
MRRGLAIALTAAVLILVPTSNSQYYEPLNRTHCIVDELAAAGFFDQ